MAVKEASHLAKIKIIPLAAAAAAEQNTGWSIPSRAIVKNVYLRVITAEATATSKLIDVGTMGTSNDPDGFLNGVSTATIGVVKGTLADGAATLGALLYIDESSGDLVPECNVTAGATADLVSWTPAEAQTEFAGELIIEYIDCDG